jgi:4-hydroxybenzoate polyprenyltransferase
MKLWEAWITVVVGLALYLYSTWLLSDFCLKYSWIPLVAFVLYPMFKRFTKWTHVGLGLVWSLVPLGGFFAVEPSLKGIWPVLILSLFCVFWLAGFDIIYATLDEQFDRESGVNSLPAAWGSKRALKLAGTFHLLSFIALFFLYGIFLSGPVTVMILAMIGILLYLEQKFSHYVDLAFFQINAVIGFFVLFFVIAGIKGV